MAGRMNGGYTHASGNGALHDANRIDLEVAAKSIETSGVALPNADASQHCLQEPLSPLSSAGIARNSMTYTHYFPAA